MEKTSTGLKLVIFNKFDKTSFIYYVIVSKMGTDLVEEVSFSTRPMRKRDIVRHLGRRVIRRVSGVSYNHIHIITQWLWVCLSSCSMKLICCCMLCFIFILSTFLSICLLSSHIHVYSLDLLIWKDGQASKCSLH